MTIGFFWPHCELYKSTSLIESLMEPAFLCYLDDMWNMLLALKPVAFGKTWLADRHPTRVAESPSIATYEDVWQWKFSHRTFTNGRSVWLPSKGAGGVTLVYMPSGFKIPFTNLRCNERSILLMLNKWTIILPKLEPDASRVFWWRISAHRSETFHQQSRWYRPWVSAVGEIVLLKMSTQHLRSEH